MILPWLFVSGEGPAQDLVALAARGVTVIVNAAAASAGCVASGGGGIARLNIPLVDAPTQELAGWFHAVIAAIEGARAAHGAALVHCQKVRGCFRACCVLACASGFALRA